MKEIFNELWWLPVFSLPALAWLIWYSKRRMSKAGIIDKDYTIRTLAILLAVAGIIYPSAMDPSDRLATFPRVLLIADVTWIVVTCVKIIRSAGRNERPPNQAL